MLDHDRMNLKLNCEDELAKRVAWSENCQTKSKKRFIWRESRWLKRERRVQKTESSQRGCQSKRRRTGNGLFEMVNDDKGNFICIFRCVYVFWERAVLFRLAAAYRSCFKRSAKSKKVGSERERVIVLTDASNFLWHRKSFGESLIRNQNAKRCLIGVSSSLEDERAHRWWPDEFDWMPNDFFPWAFRKAILEGSLFLGFRF